MTVPSYCSDLAVAFYDDANENAGATLLSKYDPGFSNSGGNWTINLAASGTSLQNGHYDIFLASKCGASTYSSATYADYHFDSLYIVPNGCDGNTCLAVNRFYNYKLGVHFYTANEDEKRQVMKMTDTYRYEGISSFAKDQQETSSAPVHRFYNFRQGVHFYTSNQAEASNVNNTASHTYRYEGIAYYTHTTNISNSSPVHRFYKFNQGVHFYTSNQSEASHVNSTASATYRYEGVSGYNIENK